MKVYFKIGTQNFKNENLNFNLRVFFWDQIEFFKFTFNKD